MPPERNRGQGSWHYENLFLDHEIVVYQRYGHVFRDMEYALQVGDEPVRPLVALSACSRLRVGRGTEEVRVPCTWHVLPRVLGWKPRVCWSSNDGGAPVDGDLYTVVKTVRNV